MKKIFLLILSLSFTLTSFSQEEELIKFADFERWMKRDIKESAIIGGKTALFCLQETK